MDRTLKPTLDMRKAVDDLIRSKRLTTNAIEYAKAQGYTDETLVKMANEQRERKAKIALDSAAVLYKREAEPANPSDPTPEWQIKAGSRLRKDLIGKGTVRPLRRYRARSVLEQYGDKFPMDMRTALARFMQDAVYAERVRVANLNSSGGGGGDRIGGLGDVPPEVRLAHNRHEWICKLLSPESLFTGEALVSGEMGKPDGTPFSMQEFGAYVLPSVIDLNRRWGVSAGALWCLAGQLCFLYSQCPYRAPSRFFERASIEQKHLAKG